MDINRISYDIIGAAIKVHRALGPGLLESVYEECLVMELRSERFALRRQCSIPVSYRELRLEGAYRADLIVQDSVLVELKSVDALAPIHTAQVLTYLRLTGLKLGLLINFNVPVLKQGIKRLIV
jgi:GxxExxY protein